MNQIEEELDVRSLIPIKRHEKLLKIFKDLPVGESFVFINDHDPKPLYYQMEVENDEPFKWEYLETMFKKRKLKVMKINLKANDFHRLTNTYKRYKTLKS